MVLSESYKFLYLRISPSNFHTVIQGFGLPMKINAYEIKGLNS